MKAALSISALLLLYDITRKASFDNIRVRQTNISDIKKKKGSFEVFISWLSIAWVVRRHIYCRCVACPSKCVCVCLHVYAGLADWNLWVRTEGCGHHVAWQQGKWDFL